MAGDRNLTDADIAALADAVTAQSPEARLARSRGEMSARINAGFRAKRAAREATIKERLFANRPAVDDDDGGEPTADA